MSAAEKLAEARALLSELGMPRAQKNDRTAYCLLALLNLTPEKRWVEAESPLLGITPIMNWVGEHYGRNYAPNTRETFRRQSIHQLVQAGLCIYNPDANDRPVNSPKAVYQIEPSILELVRAYGDSDFTAKLAEVFLSKQTLVEMYTKRRRMAMTELRLSDGSVVMLSAGKHSQLIREIVEEFAPRFIHGGQLLCVGDTGNKSVVLDLDFLAELGVKIDNHGKLPDVVIYSAEKNWLFLIEAVTSHGPVDSKRRAELEALFDGCTAGLVFISAFPNRKTFLKYLGAISWESEVWFADSPTHLIHFDGTRFLGPYETPQDQSNSTVKSE